MKICLSLNSCELLGECVFNHELIGKEKTEELKSLLIGVPEGKARVKVVVDFLQAQRPPKVSGEQIRKWMKKKNRRKHRKQFPKEAESLIVQNNPNGD